MTPISLRGIAVLLACRSSAAFNPSSWTARCLEPLVSSCIRKRGTGCRALAVSSSGEEVSIPGAAHSSGGVLLKKLPVSSGEGELPAWLLKERARLLTAECRQGSKNGRCVVYWMSRDQRAEDNWAMLFAREAALQSDVPLIVAFNLVPDFLGAPMRHYRFMLDGLRQTEVHLREKRIPFHLLIGDPSQTIVNLAQSEEAVAVFTDMSPLRVGMQGVFSAGDRLGQMEVPLVQVDAHNIVPVWVTSNKQEVGARTIRAKIHSHLPRFLNNTPPRLQPNVGSLTLPEAPDWNQVLASLHPSIDRSVDLVSPPIAPGSQAGLDALHQFISSRIGKYSDCRNDPNEDALSGLSPWFHFGQLSTQRAVHEVMCCSNSSSGTSTFVEEAVVRRELSDNFCFFNSDYDSLAGAAGWAQESLAAHAEDKREFIYSEEELEKALTHDDLWNAAQLQMVQEGKMHGFLRMYWAKKILEWTDSPEGALRIAIALNDKYELDGRDPNGYVGCLWSICGVHDRGWKEREIFGKVRYMNYAGCLRKFDVAQFVAQYPAAAENAIMAGGTPAKPKKRRKR